MTLKVLDEKMYDEVVSVIDNTRRNGWNLPEALYRADLLWTPERERLLRAQTLRFLAHEMLEWTPAEFLRSVNKTLAGATPTEMYLAVHAWVMKHADYAAHHDT